jgi:hypothetical protein
MGFQLKQNNETALYSDRSPPSEDCGLFFKVQHLQSNTAESIFVDGMQLRMSDQLSVAASVAGFENRESDTICHNTIRYLEVRCWLFRVKREAAKVDN